VTASLRAAPLSSRVARGHVALSRPIGLGTFAPPIHFAGLPRLPIGHGGWSPGSRVRPVRRSSRPREVRAVRARRRPMRANSRLARTMATMMAAKSRPPGVWVASDPLTSSAATTTSRTNCATQNPGSLGGGRPAGGWLDCMGVRCFAGVAGCSATHVVGSSGSHGLGRPTERGLRPRRRVPGWLAQRNHHGPPRPATIAGRLENGLALVSSTEVGLPGEGPTNVRSGERQSLDDVKWQV
jgi:hypothetical protein